jgi:hypothetical protein
LITNWILMRSSIYKFAVPALLIAAIGIFFLSPINLPYTVRTPGKLLLKREWTLCRTTDGGVIATFKDHLSGALESRAVTQFERGDAIEFHLHHRIVPDARISEGDTVGIIFSHILDLQFAQLRGDLLTSKKTLEFYKTGEKDAIIIEARNRIAHARFQAEEQRRIVERQKKLYDRLFISQQAYETAENTLKLYENNVSIAESQLQSVMTGAKNEQIAVEEARIRALENAVGSLEKRADCFILKSPFSGTVFQLSDGDTLVTIGDTSTYLVSLPIRLKDRDYISPDQDIVLTIRGINSPIHGKLMHIGTMASVLNGEQVLPATAIITNDTDKLFPGLIASVSILCSHVSPSEYFRRSFLPIFTR